MSHYKIFDIIFLISSLTSIAIITSNIFIKKQKYSMYIDFDKDK